MDLFYGANMKWKTKDHLEINKKINDIYDLFEFCKELYSAPEDCNINQLKHLNDTLEKLINDINDTYELILNHRFKLYLKRNEEINKYLNEKIKYVQSGIKNYKKQVEKRIHTLEAFPSLEKVRQHMEENYPELIKVREGEKKFHF